MMDPMINQGSRHQSMHKRKWTILKRREKYSMLMISVIIKEVIIFLIMKRFTDKGQRIY